MNVLRFPIMGKNSEGNLRLFSIDCEEKIPFDRQLRATICAQNAFYPSEEDRLSASAVLFAAHATDRVVVNWCKGPLVRPYEELRDGRPTARMFVGGEAHDVLVPTLQQIRRIREPDRGPQVVHLLDKNAFQLEDRPAGVPSPDVIISGTHYYAGRIRGAAHPHWFCYGLVANVLSPVSTVQLVPSGGLDPAEKFQLLSGEGVARIVTQIMFFHAWTKMLKVCAPHAAVLRAEALPALTKKGPRHEV